MRRGWSACDPLYLSPPYSNATPGPLISKDSALGVPDRGVLVVGAKPADDGDGAIIKLLEIRGAARSVGIWPAAFGFQLARRSNLVEMNGDALTVSGDHSASLDLKAWGIAAARLSTPAE